MDPLRKSGEQLALFWHSVDKTLRNVSTNLEQQFERTYSDKDPSSASSTKYNPHKLVTRLRDCDVALPELSLRVEAVGNVEEWLPSTITGQSSAVAAALFSALNGAGNENNRELIQNLASIDNQIDQFVEQHRQTWQQYTTRRDLLREAESIDAIPEIELQQPVREEELQQSSALVEEEEVEEEVAKPKLKPKPKTRAPPSSRPKKNVPPTKSTAAKKKSQKNDGDDVKGFVPIQKSAFNRLPRNLKVGKLPEINSFYEKVYNVLKDRGSMEEDELLAAVDETKVSKLACLRGLSVLRNGPNGWYLAGAKK